MRIYRNGFPDGRGPAPAHARILNKVKCGSHLNLEHSILRLRRTVTSPLSFATIPSAPNQDKLWARNCEFDRKFCFFLGGVQRSGSSPHKGDAATQAHLVPRYTWRVMPRDRSGGVDLRVAREKGCGRKLWSTACGSVFRSDTSKPSMRSSP